MNVITHKTPKIDYRAFKQQIKGVAKLKTPLISYQVLVLPARAFFISRKWLIFSNCGYIKNWHRISRPQRR